MYIYTFPVFLHILSLLLEVYHFGMNVRIIVRGDGIKKIGTRGTNLRMAILTLFLVFSESREVIDT